MAKATPTKLKKAAIISTHGRFAIVSYKEELFN
jgi:hypothetical protein